MSKAFVKDSDHEDESLPETSQDGGKNYMTPSGWNRMRKELTHLLDTERPKVVETVTWAASNGDRSENADYIYGKKRLREIDRRIRFLQKRLEVAEVVNPAEQKGREVRFGATVEVENEEGITQIYRIVGVDEINASSGKISWVSPIGRALLGKKKSDSVSFTTPKGEQEITILNVKYEAFD